LELELEKSVVELHELELEKRNVHLEVEVPPLALKCTHMLDANCNFLLGGGNHLPQRQVSGKGL